MAILGLAAAIGLTLRHSWQLNTEVPVSVKEIAAFEKRSRPEAR
jgi:hypothetical protein